MNNPLHGKKILVTGGTAKEVIDGVRFYANRTRPSDLGHRVAGLLREQGAQVFLVSARNTLLPPRNVPTLSNALSGADLLKACATVIRERKIDAVFHLANIANFRPVATGHEKIRFRPSGLKEFEFDAEATPDFLKTLAFPLFAGYNRQQEGVSDGDEAIIKAMRAAMRAAEKMPEIRKPSPPPPATPVPEILKGLKVIVTAGATAEKLNQYGDVLTHFSSTKEGFALAEALAAMGALVTLVTSKSSQTPPQHPHITIFPAGNCIETLAGLQKGMPADVFINAAAIGDFSLSKPLGGLPHPAQTVRLQMSKTMDVLEMAGGLPAGLRPRLVIGCMGGTEGLLQNAQGKIAQKKIDALLALPVDRATREKLPDGQTRPVYIGKGTAPADWGASSLFETGLKLGQKIARLLESGILSQKMA